MLARLSRLSQEPFDLLSRWAESSFPPPSPKRGYHPHKPNTRAALSTHLPEPYLDGTAKNQQQHLLNLLHALP